MKNVYIAGHRGMVGSAILNELKSLSINVIQKSSKDLDLRNQNDTNKWLSYCKPDAVVIAAAKVGGIHANNTYPAEFLYDNLLIASNLIHASFLNNVKKLIFLGSSCIYPKYANQPIKESELLTNSLEPTNEAYAIAKIAGIKLCEFYKKQYGVDYHSLMPCNLYGIGDNYHPENSHVLPGLIRRFHEAKIKNSKEVVVWGSGTPLREFLFSKDLAKFVVRFLNMNNIPNIINIGSDYEFSIKELAEMVKDVVGFEGELIFDTSKPDGTPRKKMDNSLLKSLIEVEYTDFKLGLKLAYNDFLINYAT
jgi:GDP-L-fucose synthase